MNVNPLPSTTFFSIIASHFDYIADGQEKKKANTSSIVVVVVVVIVWSYKRVL
jgi:hypothetical protein